MDNGCVDKAMKTKSYLIREFAKLTRVTVRTLHYYDQIGPSPELRAAQRLPGLHRRRPAQAPADRHPEVHGLLPRRDQASPRQQGL
ncbi:MAG: MerR family DNA-binding transcriptional regulator [Marinilabiliales bacterium]|nr:MerR family DNA-binding transcriptional regulator [Marinilabiliales bacterium]